MSAMLQSTTFLKMFLKLKRKPLLESEEEKNCPEVSFIKRMEVGDSVRFTYEDKKNFERARATLSQHNARYKNIEYFTRVKTLSIFVKRIA